MKKFISIVIPVHKNIEYMLGSINSLIDTAENKENIEVILYIDNNDDAILNSLNLIRKDIIVKCVFGIPETNIYVDGHKWYSTMFKMAEGDFIFMLNDDIEMKTGGWDVIIQKHSDKFILRFVVLENKMNFPIVSKKLLDIENGVDNPSLDSWYECMMYSMQELCQDNLEIEVKHFYDHKNTPFPSVPIPFTSAHFDKIHNTIKLLKEKYGK